MRGIPTSSAERAPAPDLARGIMLLAIAFAHAPLFVEAVGRGPAVLNDVVGVFHQFFVNNHARPLFAFLFGYALVQLSDRQTRRGSEPAAVRKLLRRRGWWLVAIGFAHVALLVPLDILAVYGITSVLFAGMIRAKDSTLLLTAGIVLVPSTLLVALAMWFPLSKGNSTYDAGSIAAGAKGIAELFVERLQGWPFGLVAGVLMVVPGVLAGIWAARRRLLEELDRPFLVRAAWVTTIVSVAGALPAALMQVGWWAEPSNAALWTAAVAQPLTGYAGGVGLAAIIALVATRPGNAVSTAIQALGQRSLTFYLFQSIVFVAVFFPYGLGLQDELGLAGATGVAVATWLASILVADLMRRAGHRGPAEILLRRLAYPRPGQDAPAVSSRPGPAADRA
ncbi:DUF418 domain-containing protein [Nonomuraea sp. SBT364]|uniref:DUF418 domain-containing protein n=1 Tax=Nonomuraea sp. SBT364 TaxID=1580530 RepID=UPI00066BE9E8|nr:DUF418 domain-containing protein [Nonomuraea sp. SBT364]